MADSGKSTLHQAMGKLRRHWLAVVLFSVCVNMLLLVSPIYMLQVYDRVLSSGSYDTLVLLSVMAIGLLLVYGAAEGGRRRVLALMGNQLNNQLNARTFQSGIRAESGSGQLERSVTDLGRVQGFLINGTVQPLLDLPFVPLFIGLVFLIHPALGALGLLGALLLLTLAILTEKLSRSTLADALQREQVSNNFLSGVSRQHAAIVSMGMFDRVQSRWTDMRSSAVSGSLDAMNKMAFLSAFSKSLRQILQVGVLALGAYLALQQLISPGAIIASSIILGRGLAPIDQIVSMWRQIIQVRASWNNLNEQLQESENTNASVALPRPASFLEISNLMTGFPGAEEAISPQFSLNVEAGEVLLVLGASGGGKTSFLQTISGAWRPFKGKVSLGGRPLHDWAVEDRGKYIGYLPQNIELLPGTIAENIARFNYSSEEKIFVAARLSGAHEMILGLKDGYDTLLGPGGAHLSAGQLQSIGITRAIYNLPAAVFLDEPTANLDAKATARLLKMLLQIKKAGGLAVVATHDLRLLNVATNVLTFQKDQVRLKSQAQAMNILSDTARVARDSKQLRRASQ